MAYATRKTLTTSHTGRQYVDLIVIELTAAEMRAEIAQAEKDSNDDRKITIKKIDSETAKHLIFNNGYPHATGYWHDGEKIRHSKAGV